MLFDPGDASTDHRELLKFDNDTWELSMICPVLGAVKIYKPEILNHFERPYLQKNLYPDMKKKLLSYARDKLKISESLLSDNVYNDSKAPRLAHQSVTAKFTNCQATADFMIPVSDDMWDIFLICPNVSIKYTDRFMTGYLKYVFSNTGFHIRSVKIFYFDKDYIFKPLIDGSSLFKESFIPLPEKIWFKKIEKMMEKVHSIRFLSHYKHAVLKKCGSCFLKKKCDLKAYDKSENVKKIEDIKFKKMKRFKAYHGDFYMNLKEFIPWYKNILFPVTFIDFEAFQTPIPFWNGFKAYERFPFQYSMDILTAPHKKARHYDYIYKWGGENPRLAFIKALKDKIPDSGSVVAFNTAFEKKIISQCAQDDKTYKSWSENINLRFVDLWYPFKKKMVYHPAQGRRSSLKVLTPLFTSLSYDELDIGEGYDASLTFIYLKYIESQKEKKSLMKNLIKYCSLDTLSMVEIFKFFIKLMKRIKYDDMKGEGFL